LWRCDDHLLDRRNVTRAEEYRTEVIRTASARRRAAGKSAGAAAERSGKAEAKAKAKARVKPGGMPHNLAPTRTKNSSYELEVPAARRPSRKSTRKALNHQKTDSALRITQVIRQSSAPARASRAPRKPNRR